MFEEHVADYSHAASSCGSSRTGGAGRAHMSCPQLDLSFGVIAHGTDPCRQFSKQVALLAGHRTLIGSPSTTATASGHGPADHGAGRSSDTPLATDLEGAKVLVPSALWSFRLRLTPELELIQVLGADLSFAQPFEQVVAQSRWKVLPPYPRHQSPKVRRASSSLIRCCSAGSLELLNRSASWRNRWRSASWASSPDSTNSAMTRLVLARFARASVRTLRATPAERVTLCRNGLAELGMLPEYTTPHHSAPLAKRNNSGAVSDDGRRPTSRSLRRRAGGVSRRDSPEGAGATGAAPQDHEEHAGDFEEGTSDRRWSF